MSRLGITVSSCHSEEARPWAPGPRSSQVILGNSRVGCLERRRGRPWSPECEKVTFFCPTTSGLAEPRFPAGFISVNSGAPASPKWTCVPLPSASRVTLNMGQGDTASFDQAHWAMPKPVSLVFGEGMGLAMGVHLGGLF